MLPGRGRPLYIKRKTQCCPPCHSATIDTLKPPLRNGQCLFKERSRVLENPTARDRDSGWIKRCNQSTDENTHVMLTTPIKKIQQSISLTKLLRTVMFRRCASNSNATIRVLLVIECVDRVRTLGRFSFNFRLMKYYRRFGRRWGGSSERAAGELQACWRRGAHVRKFSAVRRGPLTGA